MITHVRQTIDLFRTVLIHENGIEDLYIPELNDIKNICKTVIKMADEQERKWLESQNKNKENKE